MIPKCIHDDYFFHDKFLSTITISSRSLLFLHDNYLHDNYSYIGERFSCMEFVKHLEGESRKVDDFLVKICHFERKPSAHSHERFSCGAYSHDMTWFPKS